MCRPTVKELGIADCVNPVLADRAVGEAWEALLDALGGDPCACTETILIDGSGTDVILLPCAPVDRVSKVEVLERDPCGCEPTPNCCGAWREIDCCEWDCSRAGVLRRCGCPWPRRGASVRVTLSTGWDPLPRPMLRALRSLAGRIVAAGGQVPQAEREITQHTVGATSVTFAGQPAAASSLHSTVFTVAELKALEPFVLARSVPFVLARSVRVMA